MIGSNATRTPATGTRASTRATHNANPTRARSIRMLAALVALVVVAIMGAGCGGGDEAKGPVKQAAGGKITVTSDGLNFDVGTIETNAGTFEVTYVNDDSQPHNFTIHDLDGSAISDPGGGTSTATWTLEAGKTYDFFCSIGSHEASGMKGTIVVE